MNSINCRKMSLVYRLTLALTVGFTTAHWIEPDIPEYLHICQKSDPNLVECLKNSTESLQAVLIKGIPDVGYPSIDPLAIGHLFKIDERLYGVQINAENINVLGILKFKIDQLEVVKHGVLYKIHVSFPKLQIEGTCHIIGAIHSTAVNESCSFVETFVKSIAKVKAKFSHVAGGWLTLTDRFEVRMELGEPAVRLYDLAKGRRILDNKHFTSVIDASFGEMNSDLVRVVDKVLQHQLKDLFTKLLGNFSYGQIFPL